MRLAPLVGREGNRNESSKKTRCPICGYYYGYWWVFIRRKFLKGSPLPRGERCRCCNAVLCLEGKSASVAEKIVTVALIMPFLLPLFLPLSTPVGFIFSFFSMILFSCLMFLGVIAVSKMLEHTVSGIGLISSVDAKVVVETKALSLSKCKKRGGDISKYRGNNK